MPQSTTTFRVLIAVVLCAVPSARASATLPGDTAQTGPALHRSIACRAASRKADKEDKLVATIGTQSDSARRSLVTCGSKPNCDGLHKQLELLAGRKATHEKRLDQFQIDAKAACAA